MYCQFSLSELPRAKVLRLPASTTDSIPLTGYGGLISTGLTSLRPVGTVNHRDAIEVCILTTSVRVIPPIAVDISSYQLYNS
jgi:hypothetical protein